MAYDYTQLCPVGSNNGFTIWHYRTDDEWVDVRRSGYWEDAKTLLYPGDALYLECHSFGKPFYPTVRVRRAPDGELDLL